MIQKWKSQGFCFIERLVESYTYKWFMHYYNLFCSKYYEIYIRVSRQYILWHIVRMEIWIQCTITVVLKQENLTIKRRQKVRVDTCRIFFILFDSVKIEIQLAIFFKSFLFFLYFSVSHINFYLRNLPTFGFPFT